MDSKRELMEEFIEKYLLIKYKKNLGLNFRKTNKDWFVVNGFENFWNDIINRTEFLSDDSLPERIHCIMNGIDELLRCPICDEERSFSNYTEGYRLTCGKKECYIKAKATISDVNGETPNQRTIRITKESYYSDKNFAIRRARKGLETRKKNGSFLSAPIKAAKTKEKKILENGLNISQNASKQAAETMESQLCDNGKTILQNRVEKMCNTKELVGEDGLDGYERAFKNGAGRNSSLEYYNSDLYYQGSYEKRFLDKMTDLGLIDKVKRGPRVSYKNLDGKVRQYRSDFIIENVVYEIKSCWTYDHKGTDKKRRINNKLKLRSLKREGYDVIMICDDREISFSELIKHKMLP